MAPMPSLRPQHCKRPSGRKPQASSDPAANDRHGPGGGVGGTRLYEPRQTASPSERSPQLKPFPDATETKCPSSIVLGPSPVSSQHLRRPSCWIAQVCESPIAMVGPSIPEGFDGPAYACTAGHVSSRHSTQRTHADPHLDFPAGAREHMTDGDALVGDRRVREELDLSQLSADNSAPRLFAAGVNEIERKRQPIRRFAGI